MAGDGGSGRRSLTKLAVHICEMRLASIDVKKNQKIADFENSF